MLTSMLDINICVYIMQIGGHARSEGLIVVMNNLRKFERMPRLRTENWV